MNRLPLFLLCLLMFANTGCNVIGYIAAVTPQKSKPTYVNLAGQSIAVMVWADPALRMDWPQIQLDVANSLQNKLSGIKADELKGSTFPYKPVSVARYQLDHPEIEGMPLTQVAPKIGVTRLLYIEIEDFRTRAAASVDLFRGEMTATFRVAEVTGPTASLGYEENNIRATFPPKVPEDGLPQGNDYKFYLGTIDAFTDEIIMRLVPVVLP